MHDSGVSPRRALLSSLFLLPAGRQRRLSYQERRACPHGFDKRIEPVDEVYRALPDVPVEFMDYTITGNQRVTLRESLLPGVLSMARGTVEASQELMPPGIIGPFSLETFYHPVTGFTVFEISARIVAGTNPFGEGSEYSIWTYGTPVSTAEE